jgi:glyoxylase-like metal-dependent hydrolase (beta-lactamase superfamily II)
MPPQLSITRLTARNPGPFTGSGTNTWMLGEERLAVVDPGPDDPAHINAILAAARGRPITHIVITHAHRDHVDGVARLKAATSAIVVGMGRDPADPVRTLVSTRSPSGGDFVDFDLAIDVRLEGDETLHVGDVTVEAIHTPGHAPDHLCFAIAGTDALISGDHVMGWSTSVIAPPEGHMGRYIASLETLLARPETRYLPGHGDEIADGLRTAKAYLLHRQMREQAVIDALAGGATTSLAIAEKVYDGIDRAIWPAAVLSVQAHVELLAEKGRVTYRGPLSPGLRLALA